MKSGYAIGGVILFVLGVGHLLSWRDQSTALPVAKPVSRAGIDETDRENFRGWFVYLANSLFLLETKDLPKDVSDCAGLIRYSYREALRKHDGRWAEELRLESVPPLGPVRGYVRPAGGWFAIGRQQYADFADAKTLMKENATFVGRDLGVARPADLLFFHQLEQNMPFHVMAFTGEHIVYHTGPIGDDPGEVRRPTVDQLMHHPSPRWRPVDGNSNFLGVYRWNLLSE